MSYDPVPPFRRDFDAARDPYTARNALGIPEPTGGGGPPAPADAEYITGSSNGTLSNERVLTDTASITWDLTTPGQAKANATAGAGPFQAADADLTSLAAASSTNAIYYRSAANTWGPITVGTGLTFTGGTLSATATGGGNVSNSGTPANDQVAVWTDATHIEGTSGLTFNASNVLTVADSAGTYAITLNPAGAGNVNINASGTPTDIGLILSSKGGNPVNIYTHNFASLHASFGTSTINNANSYVQIIGAFNAAPTIQPVGGASRLNIVGADLTTAPTAPTPTPATDSSTKIATTAFVQGIRTLATAKDAFCVHRNGVDHSGFGSSFARVNFTTEVFDQNNKYDTSAFRWTPAAGIVSLYAQIFMYGHSAGAACNVAIYKNGALLRQWAGGPNGDAATSTTAAVSVLDSANGTDYYECYALAGGTAGGNVYGGTDLSFFQGYQL